MKLTDTMKQHIASFEKNRAVIQAEIQLAAENNISSLNHWFPIVSRIPGVNVPFTLMLPLSLHAQGDALDLKENTELLFIVKCIQNFGDCYGYPFFLKTDLFSGKHSWENACFVQDRNSVYNNLMTIIHAQYGVGCEESLHVVMRELIQTTAPFTAFHGKMPVTCERRYFVEDGKVVFHHPYWPPHSIQEPSIENWMEELEKLNTETPQEIGMLKFLSEKVGETLGGNWSIDWLKGTNGLWYLIDMAEAQKSYKWKEYTKGTDGL